jgi:hypothetical protein
MNLPTHVWSLQTTQEAVGSSCLIFDVMPHTTDNWTSEFLVAAWMIHPDLILVEVECIIPEPQEPFVERQLHLFLRSLKIVHSERDMLNFQVFIKIIEIHDFSPPTDYDDDSSDSGSDSSGDGLPGPGGSGDILQWPHIYCLTDESSPVEEPWPSLLQTGEDVSKCQMAPIRCNPAKIQVMAFAFLCQVMDFPIKYLGLPLSIKELPRSALQPLADKVVDRLPTWQGKLMHWSGRLVLIKTTLSSIPIYTSICIELPPWLLKCLIKLMKAFIWSGLMKCREESA